MNDIQSVYKMLNWENSAEIQSKGLRLAKEIEDLSLLILPPAPPSVWECCAQVLYEKTDDVLEPYLDSLLEWLQDLNWPGAFCILNRLQNYSDENSLCNAINVCIKKAKKCRDEVWESNLRLLLHKQ